MIIPLLDFINHDADPNVVALPFHDKVNNQSYVYIEALRDIAPGEQICMSYGKLANTHLIQKYGFTTKNNPVKQSIVRFPWHDYSALIYEEMPLKK